MRKADFITQLSKLLQGGGILPELLPGFVCHGVYDEVGVDVGRIAVGGDLNLVAGPCLFRKILCNLVGLRRGQLFLRRERLNILIEVDAVQFATRKVML